MKRIKHVFYVAILAFISAITAGCSGTTYPTQPVGAYGAGYYGQGIQQTPGGGATISFTGAPGSTYYTGVELMAGPVGQGTCGYGCFSGQSTTGLSEQWQFTQAGANLTSVQVGIGGAVSGAGAITIPSRFESGNSLSVVIGNSASFGGGSSSGTVSGQIILSPNFVYSNFGGAIPSIIGVAIDVQLTGTTNFGGVLIYTSQTSTGYHGAFFAL